MSNAAKIGQYRRKQFWISFLLEMLLKLSSTPDKYCIGQTRNAKLFAILLGVGTKSP